jgi:hypothetical protein
MPCHPLSRIDDGAIAPMRFVDRPPQRLSAVGDEDQMDVTGHQAVGPDRDTVLAADWGFSKVSP